MIKKSVVLICSIVSILLTGCMQITGPNDPNYAPVAPEREPIPTPDMGSIYFQKEGISLYNDIKARHVGDVITVLLTENTNATKTANSQYEKKSQETFAEPQLFGTQAQWTAPKQLPVPLQTTANLGIGAQINADTKFTGTANGTQNNQLIGKISVVVTKIYANGNMFVRGEKWININDGDEFVRVSGIIRPEDVLSDNTIDSNRIADARISYSGTGSFASSSKPGWLMKMITSPWWPI